MKHLAPVDVPVQAFDWLAPHPLPKPALDAARRLMASWPRAVQSQLGPFLKCSVQCELDQEDRGLSQGLYGEVISGMPSPTAICVITSPIRGMIQVDLPLVMQMLDRAHGGDGRDIEITRPLTDLEMPTMLYLLQTWADLMGAAWKEWLPSAHWALGPIIESQPEYVTIAAESDWVLSARYHMEIAGAAGTVTWVWPLVDFTPLAERAAAGMANDENGMASPSNPLALGQVRTRVAVQLGRVPWKVGDTDRLTEGSVIRLPTYDGDPVTVLIEGRPKLLARIGQYRGRWALKIVSQLEGGSDGDNTLASRETDDYGASN